MNYSLNDSLENHCKIDYFCFVDYYGDTDVFECLDDSEFRCDFRVPISDRYLCKCPSRIELFKQSSDEDNLSYTQPDLSVSISP